VRRESAAMRGYALKEVAAEMRSTVGAVKLVQLRALRAAAKVWQSAKPVPAPSSGPILILPSRSLQLARQ
jgi:hypothetical protein